MAATGVPEIQGPTFIAPQSPNGLPISTREAAIRGVPPHRLIAALIIVLIWMLVPFVLTYCAYQYVL
ncbi:hypothetical protein M728_004385 (plasmid) [Ensifer sp. WSM1721]